MSKRMLGRVAWISGATSGIGEAVAHLFASEGASVAVVGRRLEQGRAIADKISNAGGSAVAIACDVREPDQIRESIEQTVQAFGALHSIINNAGMVQVKPLEKCTEQDWDLVMSVNVRSMFLATKYALPHLRKNKRSYIVNVGSISSHVGQEGTPVYTTSKHAVMGLTRSIALDYAVDGVRCNCVCPGITDTPMLREHLDAMPDPDATLSGRLQRVAMGVTLTPADVAKSILFLSSEDSSGTTGTSLIVDCGYLAAAEWHATGKTAFQEPI